MIKRVLIVVAAAAIATAGFAAAAVQALADTGMHYFG